MPYEYYLDKAPRFKEVLEKEKISAETMKVILDMMVACKPLRNFTTIKNLWKASIPDHLKAQSQPEPAQEEPGEEKESSPCPKCKGTNTKEEEGFLICADCSIKVKMEVSS
jgi:hypothetical protein